jgi:hypothetical protein
MSEMKRIYSDGKWRFSNGVDNLLWNLVGRCYMALMQISCFQFVCWIGLTIMVTSFLGGVVCQDAMDGTWYMFCLGGIVTFITGLLWAGATWF